MSDDPKFSEGLDSNQLGSYARTSFDPNQMTDNNHPQTPDIFLEDGYTTIGKVTYVTELHAREYAKLYHSQRLHEAGKELPRDVDAEEHHNCLDREKYSEARIDHHYAGFMLGAKWMRSEASIVIAYLKSNLSAVQRFRAEDAMSHINEANQLRARIKELEEKLNQKS